LLSIGVRTGEELQPAAELLPLWMSGQVPWRRWRMDTTM